MYDKFGFSEKVPAATGLFKDTDILQSLLAKSPIRLSWSHYPKERKHYPKGINHYPKDKEEFLKESKEFRKEFLKAKQTILYVIPQS